MNLKTIGDQEKVRHTIRDHRAAFSPFLLSFVCVCMCVFWICTIFKTFVKFVAMFFLVYVLVFPP